MQGSRNQEWSGGANPMAAVSIILERLEQLHKELVSFKTEAMLENQQTIQSIQNLEVSIKSSIKALEDEFTVLKQECVELKKENASLKKEMDLIKVRTDDQYNRSISDVIRISNVPFSDNEDIFHKLTLISNTVNFQLTKEMLDFYYRTSKVNDKYVPPILIKFIRQNEKINFLAACKKNRASLTTKLFRATSSMSDNSANILPIYVSENMSKQLYNLMLKGKDYLKAGVISFIWYRNGILRVRKHQGDPAIIIRCQTDLFMLERNTCEENEIVPTEISV
ncbi:hypothetical protein O3M35_011238 [Rhynocoris fuscipes]|uniref:FP protein C-terminal domain-containing protein n=1 Tax=Rhynocoris fuscipes TaxID=488301 RepID=A0AAW1CVV9_9HEMI